MWDDQREVRSPKGQLMSVSCLWGAVLPVQPMKEQLAISDPLNTSISCYWSSHFGLSTSLSGRQPLWLILICWIDSIFHQIWIHLVAVLGREDKLWKRRNLHGMVETGLDWDLGHMGCYPSFGTDQVCDFNCQLTSLGLHFLICAVTSEGRCTVHKWFFIILFDIHKHSKRNWDAYNSYSPCYR